MLRVSGIVIHGRRVTSLRHVHTAHSSTTMATTLGTLARTTRRGRGLLTTTIGTTHIHTALNRVSSTLRITFSHCLIPDRYIANIVTRDCRRSRGSTSRFSTVITRARRFLTSGNHHPHVLVTGVNRSKRSHNTGIVTDTCSSLNFSMSLDPVFSAPRRVTHLTMRGSIRMINTSSLTTNRGALVPRLIRTLGG